MSVGKRTRRSHAIRTVELVHVSGIPGAGKSTYGRWLETRHGFVHLDFDELLTGRGDSGKLALVGILKARGVEAFIAAVREARKSVVMDWGFPVENINVVKDFKKHGITVWWFDGDRVAAGEAYEAEGKNREAFVRQMAAITQNWGRIEPLVTGHIVAAVEPGPTHLPSAQIYRIMFGNKC